MHGCYHPGNYTAVDTVKIISGGQTGVEPIKDIIADVLETIPFKQGKKVSSQTSDKS